MFLLPNCKMFHVVFFSYLFFSVLCSPLLFLATTFPLFETLRKWSGWEVPQLLSTAKFFFFSSSSQFPPFQLRDGCVGSGQSLHSWDSVLHLLLWILDPQLFHFWFQFLPLQWNMLKSTTLHHCFLYFGTEIQKTFTPNHFLLFFPIVSTDSHHDCIWHLCRAV